MKFLKNRVKKIIADVVKQNDGINQILEMTLNALMVSERESFPEEEKIPRNKGNGYRRAFACGLGKQIEHTIPWDRLGIFQPVINMLIRDQKSLMQEIAFDLNTHVLTTRDTGKLLKFFYGKYYSPQAISSINDRFAKDMEQWRNRPLESNYPVVYIDATIHKVRRETVSSEAFYVIPGVKSDFTREVLSVVNIPAESATGWKEVLNDLKQRGVKEIGLIVCDNLKGLDEMAWQIYPETKIQKCVVHLFRNILLKAHPKQKKEINDDFDIVFNPD